MATPQPPAAPALHRTLALWSLLAGGLLAQQSAGQEPANTSGGPPIAEQDAYDVLHYRLELTVDPAARAIEGILTLRARFEASVPRIALDLDERLGVREVRWRGVPLGHEHRDGRIWIDLPAPSRVGEPFQLEVAYGGAPRSAPNAPWEGGFTWSETPDGQPWIATTCQGEGADLWWPCKDQHSDKPQGMDIVVSVPEGLVCASNGRLVEDRAGPDGLHTWHWRVSTPINTYGVALNIAPYVLIEPEYESVTGEIIPVQFFVLPSSLERAREGARDFLDHLRWYEEVCGPYPFRADKYGVAETPHLGMEHQTILAYGNRWRRSGFDYDWLHHHELSHEWWGNLVTCRDWKDFWIHEGIGTYCQALYLLDRFGAGAYRKKLAQDLRQVANRRPIAPRESRDSRTIYFDAAGRSDNDMYYKGAWILHTLRWHLGDELFRRVLRRWAYPDPALEAVTDGSAVRLTDSEDLIAIAEELTGQELDWFFEVYLRHGAVPELEQRVADGVLELRWETPDDLPFSVPVAVRVDGGETHRVEMQGGSGSLALPAGATFELDPDHEILRRGL